jgi:trk system potassium uptake protein TrkA
MKIVILGAGQVGSTVAENLVSEDNDITVVDIDSVRLSQLRSHLDIKTVVGHAALPSVLMQAGVKGADLLIAATQSDETNLVACKIAADQFFVPKRIARIRAGDYYVDNQQFVRKHFGVDHGICPEQSITDYLAKLITFPEALQVLEFAHGKVSMVAVKTYRGGNLVGKELRDMNRTIQTRIVAIFRNNQAVIPEGDTLIQEGDEIFFLAASENIRQVMSELRKTDKPVKRVIIGGGGNIGLRLAQKIENEYSVKVIEFNKRRAQQLSVQLKNSLILQGSATDEKLLNEENIEECDLYLGLTNDDETNVLSSLLAKRMNARRVVALINRYIYADLIQGGQIDIAIVPAQTIIGELLTYVRKGDVPVVHSLRHGAAEAMEIVVHGNYGTSHVVGRKIENIPLPVGVTIGAIVRQRESDDSATEAEEVIIPHHDTVIHLGDHVILFLINKSLLAPVEKLFQSGM